MKRRSLVTLALMASTAVPESAQARDKTVTFPVHATLRAYVHPIPTNFVCGPDQPNGACSIYYDGDGSFAGDLQGTLTFSGRQWVAPDGSLPFEETNVFTGVVNRCGSGSFSYRVTNADLGTFDPFQQAFVGDEDWTIVPGSSTSGLPGLTGSGHDPFTFHLDASVDGSFTGTVTCVVRDDD
jgi:hypothetical protein